jgi:hypothetical protein
MPTDNVAAIGPSDRPSVQMDRPSVQMDQPSVYVDQPSVHVDQPSVHVDRLSVRVGRPSVQVDRAAPNKTADTETQYKPPVSAVQIKSFVGIYYTTKRRPGKVFRPGESVRESCNRAFHCTRPAINRRSTEQRPMNRAKPGSPGAVW